MLNGFAFCRVFIDEDDNQVDFVYDEVNTAFENLIGLKKEDIVGKKLLKQTLNSSNSIVNCLKFTEELP